MRAYSRVVRTVRSSHESRYQKSVKTSLHQTISCGRTGKFARTLLVVVRDTDLDISFILIVHCQQQVFSWKFIIRHHRQTHKKILLIAKVMWHSNSSYNNKWGDYYWLLYDYWIPLIKGLEQQANIHKAHNPSALFNSQNGLVTLAIWLPQVEGQSEVQNIKLFYWLGMLCYFGVYSKQTIPVELLNLILFDFGDF